MEDLQALEERIMKELEEVSRLQSKLANNFDEEEGGRKRRKRSRSISKGSVRSSKIDRSFYNYQAKKAPRAEEDKKGRSRSVKSRKEKDKKENIEDFVDN